MYFHRIIANHATATSPALVTHREYPVHTFFTELSIAVAEEIKLALWLKQYDVAAALIDFHRRANEEPLNDTLAKPLVIPRGDQTITFSLDHFSINGKPATVGIPTP